MFRASCGSSNYVCNQCASFAVAQKTKLSRNQLNLMDSLTVAYLYFAAITKISIHQSYGATFRCSTLRLQAISISTQPTCWGQRSRAASVIRSDSSGERRTFGSFES